MKAEKAVPRHTVIPNRHKQQQHKISPDRDDPHRALPPLVTVSAAAAAAAATTTTGKLLTYAHEVRGLIADA
jgi:hypothetical protein